MTELKLISKHADSLKQIIQSALSERLHSIEEGIKRTKERLQQFESKYQLSTNEFIQSFNNDELSHDFVFDEWIGEF
jgi:vacuolar-type H+-ATPase subunit H